MVLLDEDIIDEDGGDVADEEGGLLPMADDAESTGPYSMYGVPPVPEQPEVRREYIVSSFFVKQMCYFVIRIY